MKRILSLMLVATASSWFLHCPLPRPWSRMVDLNREISTVGRSRVTSRVPEWTIRMPTQDLGGMVGAGGKRRILVSGFGNNPRAII